MTSISNIWKQLTSILSNLINFNSLEVVDRVSETQLQVSENKNLKNLAVKVLIRFYTTFEHLQTNLLMMVR